MTVLLVLGGVRSGKSAYAEARVAGLPPPWTYIATAEALDDEMAERVRRHRADRDGAWRTVEEPLDLTRALSDNDAPEAVVLVDCLTLWLSNLMGRGLDVEAACVALLDLLPRLEGFCVLVSNEVGLGVVPDNAAARAFRDHTGRLHQRIAALADEVVFTAAGLPMVLKPPG